MQFKRNQMREGLAFSSVVYVNQDPAVDLLAEHYAFNDVKLSWEMVLQPAGDICPDLLWDGFV